MTDKRSWLRLLIRVSLACTIGHSAAVPAQSDPAATLRAKYVALVGQLQLNQFKRPLVLDSTETSSRLQGDIYALVDYPFAAVSAGLNSPQHWCDVLLLHINTKYCHAAGGPAATVLRVYIGKKTAQALADAARIDFSYRAVTVTPEYFNIELAARNGPLGTSDYLIRLDAVALPPAQISGIARTFLHLTYSYAVSFSGRVAMQAYLATLGSDKVGFSPIGTGTDGQTEYLGGVRGLVERNTMRYYLAIDAYLDAAATLVTPAIQFDRRLQAWFAAVEEYPRQLHEMDRAEYLEMKHAEDLRQQTLR